jgi:hypothetical protein
MLDMPLTPTTFAFIAAKGVFAVSPNPSCALRYPLNRHLDALPSRLMPLSKLK